MSPKKDFCVVNNLNLVESKHNEVWKTSQKGSDVKCYTYEEAVDLTGHGLYSVALLVTACFSLLGMTLDMFALSAISSTAACDLQIGTREEKILLSVPFLGPIMTAYLWGYMSDIYGRRRCLVVAMWTSFLASCLGAFSPHWIVLAILKIISASCSSGCAQSTSYTLLGESCGAKVTAVYFYILTSVLHFGFAVQIALQYYTLTLDFSFDFGLLTFVPWRLLTIIIALPLGASAICLLFIYESPKFLANAGKESEAIDILAKIWQRNGCTGKTYPIEKLIVNEECSVRRLGDPFLQSLWNQTVPLFKMPLLLTTFQLYFLIVVIYGCCGCLLTWFPFLADAFITGEMADHNRTEGLCNIISQYVELKNTGDSSISCTPKSNLALVWASLTEGVVLATINCSIGFLASRKKFLMITMLLIPSLAALGSAALPSNVISLTTFFTIPLAVVGTGIVMSYCVDLYPTSYRGMAACLAVLVARLSNLVTINVVGSYIIDYCHTTFYSISAIFFSKWFQMVYRYRI